MSYQAVKPISKESEMQTFDEYWTTSYTPTGMPAIFDVAMREIAYKSWNAAMDTASKIANTYDDQNTIMDVIGDYVVV